MRLDPTMIGSGLPPVEVGAAQIAAQQQAALENFNKIFAIRPDDKVLFLLDRTIDPQVMHAIWGLAKARGASAHAYFSESAGMTDVPDELRSIIQQATFVVSTWFCSTGLPFLARLRREQGQRWVKITYFRDIRDLQSEQAAFPIEIISLLLRKTAAMYPSRGDAQIHASDGRGTDLTIDMTEAYLADLLKQSRWKGELTAEKPGCYVHYLPTHGPNFFNLSAKDANRTNVNGLICPQWGVGFAKPFEESIRIVMENNRVVSVEGVSDEAKIMRDTMLGARLMELGCGFNPKARRTNLYPAGSNSPGAIHFGFDLLEESDYIKKMLPNWAEPAVHMDLVALDSTIRIGNQTLVQEGFLTALRDPDVRALAARFGEPAYLLEHWPM